MPICSNLEAICCASSACSEDSREITARRPTTSARKPTACVSSLATSSCNAVALASVRLPSMSLLLESPVVASTTHILWNIHVPNEET
ncbi:hypothetical protein LIER_38398 [Lithospermum erythrorhizon]|uniref:Uncharacterized protein n=1 Tax=Lithospermum erythrorhizon TaxID=34254 RepID=A0AAV3Q034_LITER